MRTAEGARAGGAAAPLVFAHVTKRDVVEYGAAENGNYAEDKVGVFRHGLLFVITFGEYIAALN